MRAVVQRVHSAECVVDGETVSSIGYGLVAYIGVFGAHMDIMVHNDGPINVIIDTRELRK